MSKPRFKHKNVSFGSSCYFYYVYILRSLNSYSYIPLFCIGYITFTRAPGQKLYIMHLYAMSKFI